MGQVDWPRRILTVLVGIPTALKLLASDAGMWGLATTLCVFCVIEFATNIAPRIAPQGANIHGRHHVVLLVIVAITVCAAAWQGGKLAHDAAFAAASFVLCFYHLCAIKRVDLSALAALLLDQFALSFVIGGFSHAILLRDATRYGLGFQVLGLACAWVCDSGALVAGNFFGRRKLAPALSPGKTIEGAIAGVFSALATVVLMFHLPVVASVFPWISSDSLDGFLPVVTLQEQLILGIVLGVLCIAGDLVESLLKRVADVKDSGVFFPGHGGCLDRMDSVLFVAQALYYYSHYRFPSDAST